MRENEAQISRLLVLLAVLLLTILLSGCGRASQSGSEDNGMIMTLAVDPNPPLFGRPCLMTITITDKGGEPVEGVTLRVKGDMTHAGMVPVIVETENGSGGVYSIPFEWTLGGDWIVTVVATPVEGEPFQRQFELTVEIPGG